MCVSVCVLVLVSVSCVYVCVGGCVSDSFSVLCVCVMVLLGGRQSKHAANVEENTERFVP